MKFSYKETALISDRELAGALKKLETEVKRMKHAASLGYEDERASINLPFDKKMLENVRVLVRAKLGLKPSYLVVVGIGGSNLGTMAVQEAVLGKLHNQVTRDLKVLYADTVDSDMMSSIMGVIEPALKSGENVIINGISKSGETTEPIANFEVLVGVLKRYRKDYEKYVVVTSDRGSGFWNLAQEKGFDVLEIPKKVGGRYSVFSPVGLFPLGMLGVKIEKLLEGAREIREKSGNMTAISAALIYLQKKKGKNIHDLFLFSTDLESLGKWYRQLMGESLGKKNAGITPTVSIGSTDLHSMAQLYLGGPHDKFTTFIKVEKNNSEIKVPEMREYSQLVKGIQGKSLEEIMNAIISGVQTAFKKGNRPFMEIILPDKSEYSIGELLQFKMMEMMYLGYLLGVNPFDQPDVERYKSETRKILAGGKE